jgi:hypothetical protein
VVTGTADHRLGGGEGGGHVRLRPERGARVHRGRRDMAHVDTWEGGTNATYLDFIYNVTMAVGPIGTAPNWHDDVLLVQYLLKQIVSAGYWIPPTLSKPFPVDGRMGTDTAAWIWDYQLSKRHLSINLDGRVDRALGVWTSITHTQYTIVYMNLDYQNACYFHRGSLDLFNALEDDIEAPPALRSAIKLSRSQGLAELPWESPGLPKGS